MLFPDIRLSKDQIHLINLPFNGSACIAGHAGCGKTTVGLIRLSLLINQGVNLDSILILVPQRVLGAPYYRVLQNLRTSGSGQINILTIGGLAKRMIDFFWPYINQKAGFKNNEGFPVHLTLETSEYIMSQIVDPLVEQGLFESVAISRSRLYSQILDNLNKSSLIGFSHEEIGTRLKDAWSGEPVQNRVYDDVQLCANKFREYCLEHNLLDFSLHIKIFFDHIWKSAEFNKYFKGKYSHLFVDNIEEDTPVTMDFLSWCLNDFKSALVIHDWGGGYRRFLGAYPDGVSAITRLCGKNYVLDTPFVSSDPVWSFRNLIHRQTSTDLDAESQIRQRPPLNIRTEASDELILDGVSGNNESYIAFKSTKYFPEMLDWVTHKVINLVINQNIAPSQIVIMAPYMSDVLQFGLLSRLQKYKIPVRTLRPSRSLAEHPAITCLLTFAAIAHPEWEIIPSKFDFSRSLVQSIEGMDLIRAQLLTEIVFRIKRGIVDLSGFGIINEEMAQRIGSDVGGRYEILRQWIGEYWISTDHREYESLDWFISALFGEVLSQPGFGFHNSIQKASKTAELVESIRKFRAVTQELNFPMIGKEYYLMVQRGTIASLYIKGWVEEPDESVLITPANTFLMRNMPAKVQFWLDIGSRGWYQRLNQPLTQPYVLSRDWPPGRKWTDLDEVNLNQENLNVLANGLLRRCSSILYLCFCDVGEQGSEQRGLLLHAFQKVIRSIGGHIENNHS